MEHGEFLSYIGPATIHDGVVKKVRHREANLEVEIQGVDGANIAVVFHNVTEIRENHPEGMMLYAIAEFKHPEGKRFFGLVNWEDENDANLSVVSEEVTFQVGSDSRDSKKCQAPNLGSLWRLVKGGRNKTDQ